MPAFPMSNLELLVDILKHQRGAWTPGWSARRLETVVAQRSRKRSGYEHASSRWLPVCTKSNRLQRRADGLIEQVPRERH